MRLMKYIELFAGIGGFRHGIERAFHHKQSKRVQQRIKNKVSTSFGEQFLGTQPLCVYSNEWDKYAAQIYDKNFGGKIDTRDITTVPTGEIPDHDLLVGGFPCQAFSVAGKRQGFEDTRGTLFFEIARICEEKKPRLLLLENVKGLLSHDKGRTFQTILGVLSDLGYRTEWQVLNSKDFGVPQNRERVFIIGHLRGQSSGQVFPIFGQTSSTTKRRVSGCLQARWDCGFKVEQDKERVRTPAPKERERLQGFPDNWTVGVSDTQRYKMLGNAVTVNVIEAIAERLL